MKVIGKLVYYVDNMRKVAVIDTSPFFVGSAPYCNLKIPYKEKKAFFKIENQGIFFTISSLEEKGSNLVVNGEEITKKTLLTNGSEIIYGGIKFIFEKENKQIVALHTRDRLQEVLRNMQFKLRFNLPFIVITVCVLSISMLFFLLYKSYLSELEENEYESIIKKESDSNIEKAKHFLRKYPSSKYSKVVKKYLEEKENLKVQEEKLVLEAIQTKDITKIKEIAAKLKTTEGRSLIFDFLLQDKTMLKNTNEIINIITTIKEFESIKQSISVSNAYNKIDTKIENTTDSEKVLWINLKNLYELEMARNFRRDINILKKLNSIDRDLKCAYLENLLYFYDIGKFTNILEKEKVVCTKTTQNNKIKVPKTLFTKQRYSQKIKKYYVSFLKALNSFNITEALQKLKIFIGLIKISDVDVEKYIVLSKSLEKIIEKNIVFDINTCTSKFIQTSDYALLEDLVRICLLIKGIKKDDLAINIYKNPKISSQQKSSMITEILGLEEVEGYILVKNVLIPYSVYGCEIVKNSLSLTSFKSALIELKKVIESNNINHNRLTQCLNKHLPETIKKIKKKVEEVILSNKEYIQIGEARNALDVARKEAIEKIFDEKFYTYDIGKNDHGEKAQPEIDRLVGKVKEIWNKPLKFLENHIPTAIRNVMDICFHLTNITQKLKLSLPLSDTPEASENPICFLVNHNIGIDLKRLVLNENERIKREWDKETEEYNNKFNEVDIEEKNTLKVINDYRNMLGFQSLKFDKILIKAANHHAKYLSDVGTLTHFEEDERYRDVLKRAQHYGYKGSSAGENIYLITYGHHNNELINRSDTFSNHIFRGWYNSSGHHRNLLCKCCKYAGIARATKNTQKDKKEYWVLVVGCN